MNPFKGGNIITQGFGERPDYYKQFGLAGHEGMDMVPADNDRTIHAVEDGVVVRDVDDPRSGAYGIYTVILNKDTKRAWWYCHESVNNVKVGDTFKKGDAIAVMGGTGNVQGDHLHLGLRYADDNGNATNTDNGYSGFVDPSTVLADLNAQPTEPMVTITQKELDEIRLARDQHYNDLQKANETITNLNSQIQKIQSESGTKDTKISSLEAQVSTLTDRVNSLQNQIDSNTGTDTLYQQLKKDYDTDKINWNAQFSQDKQQIAALQRQLDKIKSGSFTEKLRILFSK